MAKKKNQVSSNEKNDGGDGGGDGEKKQKANGVTVVLKIDLHCEGCAGRVVKAVRTLDGVETVRIGDSDLNKLTVIGNLDPVKLRQKVEEKTKKKVELISPASKKTDAGDGDDKKKQQKGPEKVKQATVQKEEKKPKELPVITAVLKVSLHCHGCVRRIHKLVTKTKGYVEMSVDKNKDLVTVKGAMDMTQLAEALKSKLKRAVEIVPAKKDGGDGGGEKKGKGGGEKKGGGGGGNDGEGKGGGNGGGEKKGKGGGGGSGGGEGGNKNNDGGTEAHKMESYGGPMVHSYPQYVYGPEYADYMRAPMLFSDENPNACVVM